MAALTLARDCYSLTLDLAANVDVIENATKHIKSRPSLCTVPRVCFTMRMG